MQFKVHPGDTVIRLHNDGSATVTSFDDEAGDAGETVCTSKFNIINPSFALVVGKAISEHMPSNSNEPLNDNQDADSVAA